MRISEVVSYLEGKVPKSMQEGYDNCGVQVGDVGQDLTGILVSLDCTEDVVQDAIDQNCNLIVAHHPIIFKGLKNLTGKNYVERTVLKAIKSDIVVYAIHTNLDNYRYGVNFKIGEKLGLQNLKVLTPKYGQLVKISVFVPNEHLDVVRDAMFKSGAGNIGDYTECGFTLNGHGSFMPMEGSNPFSGEQGQRTNIKETRFEAIVSKHQLGSVVHAMKDAHPYEEVAYDMVELLNENPYEGSGMIGELPQEVEVMEFLADVKEKFKCGAVRYTQPVKDKVQKVAFCGGSGSFLLRNAMAKKADVYITGDFKYHEFFDAENRIVIADIGHFESEQFTIDLIAEDLRKIFPKFAVHFTRVNTNPINYL